MVVTERTTTRETEYAKELVPSVEIDECRIERLYVKGEKQVEIRLSWWPGGVLAPRPLDVTEDHLIALLAESIRKGVVGPTFLPSLIVACCAKP
jgi:hypothetical protein